MVLRRFEITRRDPQPEPSPPTPAADAEDALKAPPEPAVREAPLREQVEPPPLPPAIAQLRATVHEQLLHTLDTIVDGDDEETRLLVREAILALLAQQEVRGLAEYRERLVQEIVDDVLGLGVLEPLLRDDTVTEVMVNAPDRIFVETAGRLYRSTYAFRDEEHLMRIIERIMNPLGRHVDEASPMADARLPDGSRVNVVVPPASPRGATITLRKFARQRLRADDLISIGTVTPDAMRFLRAAVQARLNILVAGGTGSGKTTLLNVLSSCIEEDERIVTVEDPLELQLQQPHVVALEARPPGLEGTRQIAQRDLVRNALRMRPDRIIVGEVRGAEAFDMLQAMNTGHDGSISTVHANSPRDALSRVENMVMMAGFDLPERAIREQIASAVQLCVQISRLPDGSRRLTHITEVTGMESQTITLQDLFVFHVEHRDEHGRVVGALAPTGLQPHHAERFRQRNVTLPMEVFRSDRWQS
jgi:pilus assembly protein CpaF